MLLKCATGWINGSGANVFVTNHDTERVRNTAREKPSCCRTLTAPHRTESRSTTTLRPTPTYPRWFSHSHTPTADPPSSRATTASPPTSTPVLPTAAPARAPGAGDRKGGSASTVGLPSRAWSASGTMSATPRWRSGSRPSRSRSRSDGVSRLCPC